MDPVKPFWQSKKFWMTIAGIGAMLLPVLMESIPKESSVYALLGAVASVIAYVTAQGKVDAAKALGQGAPQDPPKAP